MSMDIASASLTFLCNVAIGAHSGWQEGVCTHGLLFTVSETSEEGAVTYKFFFLRKSLHSEQPFETMAAYIGTVTYDHDRSISQLARRGLMMLLEDKL